MANSQQSLEEDAAYITPIGQDVDGNFVYAPEDKAVLAQLEQQRIELALERKEHEQEQRPQQRRASPSWRRFSIFSSDNSAGGGGEEAAAVATADGDDEEKNLGKNESEHRRGTGLSSTDKVCGCFTLRIMMLLGMILLTVLLLGLVLLVTRPLWMPHSPPTRPRPKHDTKDNNSATTNSEVTPNFFVELDSSVYSYDTDDIVVSFSKNETYMHDFIGIYEALDEGDEDQEPLLSLRCCGSQDCFEASELTSTVTFGATGNKSDRLESWPLPVGKYYARLYQLLDGKRTVRLLAQTAETFEVVPNDNGDGPTLSPKPQDDASPVLSLANDQLTEKILNGEDDDRFRISSNPVVEYPDDWIGVYRTTATPADDYSNETEPFLWLYRCGFQDCFQTNASNNVVFDILSCGDQKEGWPLPWGTYQVKLQREYGTVLASSDPELIVLYPGGLTAGLYHNKMVYQEGESISIYFNNGFRDGPTQLLSNNGPGARRALQGGSLDDENPINRKPKPDDRDDAVPPDGGALGVDLANTPREWIGIFLSTDNVNDGSVMPQFFLYTCVATNECDIASNSAPYNGRVVFDAETVASTSIEATWPLPPGAYKTALVRGRFPWDVLSGNYSTLFAHTVAVKSQDDFVVI